MSIKTAFNKSNFRAAVSALSNLQIFLLIHRVTALIKDAVCYPLWFSHHKASESTIAAQKSAKLPYCPLISIVVPTFQTPIPLLDEMIDSVQSQSYTHWELCIADASGDNAVLHSRLRTYAAQDTRIKIKFLEENKGISENTNHALSLATGMYIGLLDHDDILAPNALYEIVQTLNHNLNIDVLYTDEDKIDAHHNHYYPNFKPDYNRSLLQSCNYICHFFVFKSSLLKEIGNFRSDFDGSQDYDFILRATAAAKQVYHIPQILYHWRVHPGSTAGDPAQKMYCYDAAVRALQYDLNAHHLAGIATHSSQLGFYNISLKPSPTSPIQILLLTLDDRFHFTFAQTDAKAGDPGFDIEHHFCSSDSDVYNYINNCRHNLVIILQKGILTLPNDFFLQSAGQLTNPAVGCLTYKIAHHRKVLSMGMTYLNGHLVNCYNRTPLSDVGYFARAILDQFVPLCSAYAIAFRPHDMQKYLENQAFFDFPSIQSLFLLFSLYMHQTQNKNALCLARLVLPTDKIISLNSLSSELFSYINTEELQEVSGLYALPPYLT